VVNSSTNDIPRVVSGPDRLAPDGARPTVAVELTPRGLELLETLNDLFDTLAASESGSGPARGNQGI
jgi:hypothetical protein